MLAAKVRKIFENAGERYRRVSFRKDNSPKYINVEHEIIALLKGLPDEKPYVIVRELHVALATPQPRILRALDRLQKRGKIALDMQLHDPLASKVSLPHNAPQDKIDA